MRTWRDPATGKWHADASWWRLRCVIFTLWIAVYAGLLSAFGAWGPNVPSLSVALFVIAALGTGVMWARAVRRGWRRER